MEMRTVLRVAGAGLLAATAAIHLDLYLTGYRTIPTIGRLFLFQVIAGFVLAAIIAVANSRLATAAGAGFALATLGGYLMSIWFGLFGFTEVRTTAGIVAGIIEILTFGALAFVTVAPTTGKTAASLLSTAAAVTAAIVLAATVASAGGAAPPVAAQGRTVLKSAQISGVAVLTNAQGRTLYWFAPDTPTRSACYGGCASYWPPVLGKPVAGPGVTGRLGSIHRTDGSVQATYDGHPLYTYIGDQAPGQNHGNNVNLNGGLWHEVRVTG
jgi:predicted lipoprotein with Yx(FWY)xxD motif